MPPFPDDCELFIDSCDNKISTEQLFKSLIGVDASGCPVIKTKAIVSFTSVTRTPNVLRPTAAGTIVAGARKVDVLNTGAADGVFLGQPLKVGEGLTLIAGGQADILSAIGYDATGTEFLISTIV